MIKKSDKIKDPVIKGTLRIASEYAFGSLCSSDENQEMVFSFIEELSSFYKSEIGKKSENYERRQRFNERNIFGIIDDIYDTRI